MPIWLTIPGALEWVTETDASGGKSAAISRIAIASVIRLARTTGAPVTGVSGVAAQLAIVVGS
jgi:hypothetical protein